MNRKTMVIAIAILIAFCGIYFWAEWQKHAFDAEISKLLKPLTFDEIEISDHDAKVIDFFEDYHPEWAEWKKRKLTHEAEWEALQKEFDALIPLPPGLDPVQEGAKIEAFKKSLSDKEKRAFHKKAEALRPRLEAWIEAEKTIDAEEPD